MEHNQNMSAAIINHQRGIGIKVFDDSWLAESLKILALDLIQI